MDGDVVELETEGLGRLRFNIRDDLKRTWSRETRLDRQQKGEEGPTHQLTGNTRDREMTAAISSSARSLRIRRTGPRSTTGIERNISPMQ